MPRTPDRSRQVEASPEMVADGETDSYQPTVLMLTLLYVVSIVMLNLLPETKGKLLPT
ncbi:hypothetical protein [Bradyrhizobium sp. RT10b]|uniref:hypothetical protein n=1 Tax=unclassified Bradyrhizobium TaxID=2631580 RepID=UPI0033956241